MSGGHLVNARGVKPLWKYSRREYLLGAPPKIFVAAERSSANNKQSLRFAATIFDFWLKILMLATPNPSHQEKSPR